MLDADLTGTLAIMSGILQGIHEDAKPDVIASARYAADAARLELNKWRQPVRADDKVQGAQGSRRSRSRARARNAKRQPGSLRAGLA